MTRLQVALESSAAEHSHINMQTLSKRKLVYLFISALTLTTSATQIKTTKCQPRIERLQKEH